MINEKIKKINKNDLEFAKNLFNLQEYAKQFFDKYEKCTNTYRTFCPFHAEKTPSFHIYHNRYKCFGCGATGDCLNFIASMKVGFEIKNWDNPQLFFDACSVIGIFPEEEIEIIEHQPEDDELKILWEIAQKNHEKAIEYIEKRCVLIKNYPKNVGVIDPNSTLHPKINEETLLKYPFLRRNEYLVLPMYQEIEGKISDILVGLSLRNLDFNCEDENKHRKIGQTGLVQVLTAEDIDFVEIQDTYITESFLNAVSFSEKCTVIFGIGNIKSVEHIDFKGVLADIDDAGISAALDVNKNIIIPNKNDAAVSTDFVEFFRYDKKLKTIILSFLLLKTEKIEIVDQILGHLYHLSSVYPDIKAIYHILVGFSERSIKNFLRIRDSFFDFDDDEKDKEIQYIKQTSLILRAYDEFCNKNEKIDDNEILSLCFSLMGSVEKKISDKALRMFNTCTYPVINNLITKEKIKPKPINELCFKHMHTASIAVLAGETGVGKTTLACKIGADFSNLGKTLFFSFETDKELLQEKMSVYLNYDENNIKIIEDLQNIQYLDVYLNLAANSGYQFAIIDHAKCLKTGNSDFLESKMIELERIASKTGIAILILTQLLKEMKINKYYYCGHPDTYCGAALSNKASVFLCMQKYKKMDESLKDIDKEEFRHFSYEKIRFLENINDKNEIGVLNFDFNSKKLEVSHEPKTIKTAAKSRGTGDSPPSNYNKKFNKKS